MLEPVIATTAPVKPVVVPDCTTLKRLAPVWDDEAFVMDTTLPDVVLTPATDRMFAAPVVDDPTMDTRFPV